MTGVAADEQANADREGMAQPYAPSWVDHLTAWVTGLPVPSWSFYLGLGLLLFLFQGAVLWAERAFSFPNVHRGHLFLAATIPFFLALIQFLDERAGVALAGMRADLKASAEQIQELHFQLTNLPAGPTLLAGFVALGCVLLQEALSGEPYTLEALGAFSLSANLLRLVYLLCWWVFGAFVYHTIHQLSSINCIYTRYTRINLFHTKSLYAFSNLAALTAGSLALAPYGFLVANEATGVIWEDPVVFSLYLVITFFALVTFVWPQLGIHRLQVAEKERLLGEANRRLEATIADLHEQLDSGNLETMANFNMALLTLEIERAVLGKVRTWPWEPETLRLLITALALPMGVWLVQFLLQKMLGS